jgi:hypothetical protein
MTYYSYDNEFQHALSPAEQKQINLVIVFIPCTGSTGVRAYTLSITRRNIITETPAIVKVLYRR